ncbi:hypothetical protein F6V25_05135 [Oryzomonas japonica]|uniref:Uncharacterized protein n=1 Tax=Oryzomonas japonica TaxID=2603858 RepID=A0A7J4ZTK3_9BACT|nr:hypothetical protein [Oryzomonas japonica]KAB0666800.1 hypothetical protein F6V25_05135 [Oryzomonas japonica]
MNKKQLVQVYGIPRVVVILLLTTFVFGVPVCFAGQFRAIAAANLPVPNASVNEFEILIGNARDIYEKSKTNHWKHLDKKINSIIKAEQSISGIMHDKDMPYYKNLMGATSDLERAVAAQDRIVSMKSANKIMLLGARLAETSSAATPINVAVIGFCGRKLEILAETENVFELSDTVSKLHLAWQQLIPQVTARGGIKEVKKFAEIMKRFEVAKTPDEYGKLAAAVVDQVDIIEKIFKK